MVPAASMTTGTAPGVLVADVSFRPTSPEEGRFTRADLVFSGVDHSQTSYEVRVFLNNPTADASTPRTAEHGYAGRFVIFGHGGCFGDDGHCEVPSEPRASMRLAHLTPQTKLVTVTDALRRILAEQEGGCARSPWCRSPRTRAGSSAGPPMASSASTVSSCRPI